MAGSAIDIKIDDHEVKEMLAQLLHRFGDMLPAMKQIGEVVRTSVVKNFEAGGRPEKWQPSRRAAKTGGKTLIKKGFAGGLMGSISARAEATRVVVGTNKVYAAIHQFGGRIMHPARSRVLHFKKYKRGALAGKTRFAKAGKATYGMKVAGGPYTINMPARPFLMVQDEDLVEIREMLGGYIIRGKS